MSSKKQQSNQEPGTNGVLAFALKAVDAVCKAALPTEAAEAIAKAFRRAADEVSPPSPIKREVKKHLRCPACFDGFGGVAIRRKWWRQISGGLHQRCYVCGECGCEWTVEVKSEEEDGIEKVETKVVQVRNS